MEKFYQFRDNKVIDTFGIKSVQDCPHLSDWLQVQDSLNDFEYLLLDTALARYAELSKGWNEEELKMFFISPILNVANINIAGVCKTYFERPLEGVINNYQIQIVTDCMVASPKLSGEPAKPYFFLQEFKQSQRFGKTDPQGQMLMAMLLAQDKNADNQPMYGCYVIERNWFFAILIGTNYCVSQQFDATQKDQLHQIVYILRKLKALILMRKDK